MLSSHPVPVMGDGIGLVIVGDFVGFNVFTKLLTRPFQIELASVLLQSLD